VYEQWVILEGRNMEVYVWPYIWVIGTGQSDRIPQKSMQGWMIVCLQTQNHYLTGPQEDPWHHYGYSDFEPLSTSGYPCWLPIRLNYFFWGFNLRSKILAGLPGMVLASHSLKNGISHQQNCTIYGRWDFPFHQDWSISKFTSIYNIWNGISQWSEFVTQCQGSWDRPWSSANFSY
jgi:hypothetical protein